MSRVEVRAELSDLEISKQADLWKHDVLEEDEEARRDRSDAVYTAVMAQFATEGVEATYARSRDQLGRSRCRCRQ